MNAVEYSYELSQKPMLYRMLMHFEFVAIWDTET